MYQLIQSPACRLEPVGVKVYWSPGHKAQGLLPGKQSAEVKVAFCPSVGHCAWDIALIKITASKITAFFFIKCVGMGKLFKVEDGKLLQLENSD